jgi:hypothetical protein
MPASQCCRDRSAATWPGPRDHHHQSGTEMVAAALHPPSPSSGSSGPIVGGDPTRRYFDGWLAQLIKLRDQTCRIPSVTHRSGTSTTSPGTARADAPHSPMDAASANAATWSARCPDGTSPSSAAVCTAGHTRSSSPHPPATTTAAAHQIHHEDGRRTAWEHVQLCEL